MTSPEALCARLVRAEALALDAEARMSDAISDLTRRTRAARVLAMKSKITYRAKLMGCVVTGDKPYVSYSGKDKFRGSFAWHSTREAAINRAAKTIIGEWKLARPINL